MKSRQLKFFPNEIYSLVDEDYIAHFDNNHQDFMQNQYYNYYWNFCKTQKRRPLTYDLFFSNMHRRRVKIHQLCCPYCGSIRMLIHDNRLNNSAGFNYCPHCGRGSVLENMSKNFYYYVNLHKFHEDSFRRINANNPNVELSFEKQNCARVELIELVTIIEVTLKEYFDALLYINNALVADMYINKLIQKSLGNDFMNIEKANIHFKKAFDLDIKSILPEAIWNNFIDIVAIRNVMVHKNGRADNKFKKTPTYARVKKLMDLDYFLIKGEDIDKYFDSVVQGLIDITNCFLSKYYAERNKVIANHYFNNPISKIV